MPLPTVVATAVPESAPRKFKTPAISTARPGESTRVATEVAMALAGDSQIELEHVDEEPYRRVVLANDQRDKIDVTHRRGRSMIRRTRGVPDPIHGVTVTR